MSLILRENIGRRLTIAEVDNNFIYLEDLANSNGGTNNVEFVNHSFNGLTLSSTASVFFCSSNFYYTTVNLPDASIMLGKELKFINVANTYEGSFNIDGPFFDSSSGYNLNGFGHTLTIISDGNVWWVLNQFTA